MLAGLSPILTITSLFAGRLYTWFTFSPMLSFHKLFQKVFTSFDIGKDTSFIQKLDTDGVNACMIIKRSWIYGAFIALALIPIGLLFAINIGLLMWAYPTSPFFLTICALLAVDFLYLAFEHFRYFLYFRRVYGAVSQIVRPHTIRYESEEGNRIFARIFDHVILSIVFLAILMIATIGAQFFVKMSAGGITVTAINALIFFTQMGLMWGFVKKVIQLEMDFTIVVPGKVWFFNQSGLLADSKVIDADKVKSVTGSIGSFLGSFFGYGNLSILTEGDALGVIDLQYIGNPEKTASRIDVLLSANQERIDEATLGFLDTVLAALGIQKQDIDSTQARNMIREYLKHFESEMKADFQSSNPLRQKEIAEVYTRFS